MVFHEKTVSSACSVTMAQVLSFETTCVICYTTDVTYFIYFMRTSYFVTQNFKDMYSMLRFIKVSNFYCFIKGHRQWNWLFFGPSASPWGVQWLPLVHFGAPALICVKAPQFDPPLLLCHQCKCQHSGKKQITSSIIIMKRILTSWTPWKTLRNPYESKDHTLRTTFNVNMSLI